MDIIVAYDSYFGNTEKVAKKIAESLEEDVTLLRVEDVEVSMLAGLDKFILGSPTRAFKASDKTRAFLKKLEKESLKGVKVAAFDTRIDPEDVGNPILKFMVKLFGYAAKPMADKLVKSGGVSAGSPAGFAVFDTEGPLREGELERAAEWAKSLA